MKDVAYIVAALAVGCWLGIAIREPQPCLKNTSRVPARHTIATRTLPLENGIWITERVVEDR